MRRTAALIVTIVLGAAACQRTDSAKASAADCSRVGETLAQFEVGNYAEPEQRAAAVAKHRQACETTNVTADEADCLGHAKDTWAARACLPRMFPAKQANADCATVIVRMREAVMSQVGSDGSAAAAQLDKMLPIVKSSCEQDSWPAPVVRCIVDAKPGEMDAFQRCSNQLPQGLQEKLAQRLLAMPPGGPSPQQPPPAPQPPK